MVSHLVDLQSYNIALSSLQPVGMGELSECEIVDYALNLSPAAGRLGQHPSHNGDSMRIRYEDRCQIYALNKAGPANKASLKFLGVGQSAVVKWRIW